MFEIFEHTADVGLRIRAPDLDSLFVDAGRGLFALIVENLEDVAAVQDVSIRLAGGDRPHLFLDWLRELVYVFDSRHLLLSRFDVQVDEAGLRATAGGEPLDASRHRLDHEVKAITYHGLRVEATPEGWLAEVIIDV